jgi:hypothetical protein
MENQALPLMLTRHFGTFRVIALSISVLLVLVLSPRPAFAISETEEILSQLAERVIEGHIRPRYQRVFKQSQSLSEGLSKLCSAPSAAKLENVRGQFRLMVMAYAGVEHIQFGPVSEDYRYERLSYWPDRKGRGLRAVRRLLKRGDESVLDPKVLAKKSVAVQGLTALEFLLFGKGADKLAGEAPGGVYRCRYSLAIAQNIHMMAGELVRDWQEGAPIVTALTTPGSSNKFYRSRKEVILEFYKVVTGGLARVHDLKLSPLPGRDAAHAKPKRAAFWRSDLALDVIKENLLSIQDFVTVSRFRELLPKKPIDLPFYVDKLFKGHYRAIDSFKGEVHDGDLAAILADKAGRERFKALMKMINHASVGFGRNLAIAADLPMGFNASDGD